MNVLKNKNGMTLVEMVVGIAVMAIVGVTLVTGFSGAANITNKANQFKNASTTTSSTLELEEVQTSKDDAVSTSFDYTDTTTITYTYKNGATEGQLSAVGLYGLSEESGTGLTYKEFYPNNFQFEVEADDIEEDK